MRVVPMAVAANQPQQSIVSSSQDARAKAIAMLSGNQGTAQAAVPDQNNIQPEETGAIKASTQEETPAIETTEPEIKETKQPEEDPAITKYFAQLAKQEKALRAKEAAFKQREAELKAKEESLQIPQKVDTTKYISKDMLKQDALTALAEAGISFEELTNQLLNQTPKDPRVEATISELKAEIQALKQSNEKTQKTYEQQQRQQYQAAVKQIETDVKKLVYTDPNFETIKASNASNDVVELITETFNKDGILLTVEEAAQQVEDYLVEQYTKFTSLNKIKQRLEKSSATTSKAPEAKTNSSETDNKKPQMKTLTNNTSSSRQLSARERALLAFKNELK